jgi:glycosyltransferase involved in cell wall biosynthesis
MIEELKRIVFVASRCAPIHARSLEERPLGGTETGIIRLSKELCDRGYDVTVITSHRSPPTAGSEHPKYLPLARLGEVRSCDVLIAVQDWWGAFLPIATPTRMYWTGDAPDQYLTYGIGDRRVQTKIDGILSVGSWQADTLSAESGYPREKLFVIRNGVHLPWFDDDATTAVVRRRRKLIFASSPYRGLQLVAPLFSELVKQLPQVELHVFSGLAVYDKEQPYQGPEVAQYEQLKQVLSELPRCYIHGNVTQERLAQEYLSSSVLFYPCMFPETSCMVALDSLAAGCPVVTSAIAGLPESIGDAGLLVPGTPGTPEYMHQFFQSTFALLTNDGLWQTLSERGRTRMRAEYGWNHVADRFLNAVSAVKGIQDTHESTGKGTKMLNNVEASQRI